MSEMDEIVGEFLVESYENLDRYDQDLLTLEREPDDRDVIASIFRTVHTIKGTCGFLGFERLESVTHVAENLLGRLRDGELVVDADIATLLLETGDAVRAMLGAIEATGEESPHTYEELVARLVTAVAGGEAPDVSATSAVGEDRLGELLVRSEAASTDDVVLALHAQELGDERPIGQILHDQAGVPDGSIAEALHQQSNGRGVADASIRVDVAVLDNLMTLVGELVLARNQIVQLSTAAGDAGLVPAAQRLDLITTELQEGAMKTRMQPIGTVWSKFTRVVRDLAQATGKQVRLELEGEETELDRTILEAIKDPLTHLVRNAVDHGVETPEARTAAGKPTEGTLLLRAFHEGGQVNIEISDDGRGIDVERVRAKAVERGLVPAATAATLAERDVLDLIFQPGFSTAERVTNVSGRGVGMDVVRTNIERIGGSVEVTSIPGTGATFGIKIPLTLAIIPALIVTSGEQRFAIPQSSLLELVRVDGAEADRAVEFIHGAPVYRLRGRLLPLVRLADVLDLSAAERSGALNIVVLQADDRQFGLVVDGISDTAEIVVKPLGAHLKGIAAFAGATILGDGFVALILDVLGLAREAHVIDETRSRHRTEHADDETLVDDRTSLLLCANGDSPVAIPLALVDRLEEFSLATVERTGEREVVQYRDGIMPLVRLGWIVAPAEPQLAPAPGEALHVVVYRAPHGNVGIVVDRIDDVVDHDLDLTPSQRHGVLGTVVVDQRVTEVLDLPAVIDAAGVVPSDAYPVGV